MKLKNANVTITKKALENFLYEFYSENEEAFFSIFENIFKELDFYEESENFVYGLESILTPLQKEILLNILTDEDLQNDIK